MDRCLSRSRSLQLYQSTHYFSPLYVVQSCDIIIDEVWLVAAFLGHKSPLLLCIRGWGGDGGLCYRASLLSRRGPKTNTLYTLFITHSGPGDACRHSIIFVPFNIAANWIPTHSRNCHSQRLFRSDNIPTIHCSALWFGGNMCLTIFRWCGPRTLSVTRPFELFRGRSSPVVYWWQPTNDGAYNWTAQPPALCSECPTITINLCDTIDTIIIIGINLCVWWTNAELAVIAPHYHVHTMCD